MTVEYVAILLDTTRVDSPSDSVADAISPRRPLSIRRRFEYTTAVARRVFAGDCGYALTAHNSDW
jgi:hypothetical protein